MWLKSKLLPQFIPLHYSRLRWDFLLILSSRKLKWLLLTATNVKLMWKSAWNILPPQIMSNYYTNLITPNVQLLNTFEFTTMISAVLEHHTSHIKILKKLYIQLLGLAHGMALYKWQLWSLLVTLPLTYLCCHPPLPSHKWSYVLDCSPDRPSSTESHWILWRLWPKQGPWWAFVTPRPRLWKLVKLFKLEGSYLTKI